MKKIKQKSRKIENRTKSRKIENLQKLKNFQVFLIFLRSFKFGVSPLEICIFLVVFGGIKPMMSKP
jgi:hypothetical protein